LCLNKIAEAFKSRISSKNLYFSVIVLTMKYLALLLLLFSFSSCEYFDKKKISSEEILQEELRTFNWSEVDEYPSFTACDNSSTKDSRKQCFESTLTNHILTSLQSQRMVVTKDLNDTIEMKFHISEKGQISILEMNISDQTLEQIPEIEKYLTESISSTPQISPAIKRSQHVKTEFKLPIVLLSD